MTVPHVTNAIRFLKGSKDSTDDIINIVLGMEDKGFGPAHDGTSRSDLEDDLGISLDYEPETGLGHAVDIGLVNRDPHDSEDLRNYAIAEWMDGGDGEIVNGRVQAAADEGIEAIIGHMMATDPDPGAAIADGGVTHRDVLADEFGIGPGEVEGRLREGDSLRTLNKAVDAIEESGHVSTREDYGRIEFRYEGYSYTLTSDAVRLFGL